jgi:ABC-type Mn2+/Zn2+ transport system ATPase subunit
MDRALDTAAAAAPAATAAPLVALRGAAVGYRRRPLLAGVELAVAPGDFLAIVGPNGGGKTTVLRSLLGALPLLRGRR